MTQKRVLRTDKMNVSGVIESMAAFTSICSFGEIEGGTLILISIHVHDILNSQRYIGLHREWVRLETVMSETKGPKSISVG